MSGQLILADHSLLPAVIGYWHNDVVRPTDRLWRHALWLNDTSYSVSIPEYVWTSELQRSTLYTVCTDHEASNFVLYEPRTLVPTGE